MIWRSQNLFESLNHLNCLISFGWSLKVCIFNGVNFSEQNISWLHLVLSRFGSHNWIYHRGGHPNQFANLQHSTWVWICFCFILGSGDEDIHWDENFLIFSEQHSDTPSAPQWTPAGSVSHPGFGLVSIGFLELSFLPNWFLIFSATLWFSFSCSQQWVQT